MSRLSRLGCSLPLLLLLLTGCRSERVAFQFTPPLRPVAIAGPGKGPAPAKPTAPNETAGTTALFSARGRTAQAARARPSSRPPASRIIGPVSPGQRGISRRKAATPIRETVKSLLMVADTSKQAKPRKKIFQNSKFLRSSRSSHDTSVSLYLIGLTALAAFSLITGIGIGGFWGILLGGIIFPALLIVTLFASFIFRFDWPFNIVFVTALLATVGATVFGIAAAASLGVVAWIPLAVIGAFNIAWATFFDR